MLCRCSDLLLSLLEFRLDLLSCIYRHLSLLEGIYLHDWLLQVLFLGSLQELLLLGSLHKFFSHSQDFLLLIRGFLGSLLLSNLLFSFAVVQDFTASLVDNSLVLSINPCLDVVYIWC